MGKGSRKKSRRKNANKRNRARAKNTASSESREQLVAVDAAPEPASDLEATGEIHSHAQCAATREANDSAIATLLEPADTAPDSEPLDVLMHHGPWHTADQGPTSSTIVPIVDPTETARQGPLAGIWTKLKVLLGIQEPSATR